MFRKISLITLSALILAGCATKEVTPVPEGQKLPYFTANIAYDESNSRGINIAHAFGALLVKDQEPGKKNLTFAQQRFYSGLVNFGANLSEGSLRYTSAKFPKERAPEFRGEKDEWNVFMKTDGYASIYDAQVDAINEATALTAKGLHNLGFKTQVVEKFRDEKTGELVELMENRIHLIDKKRGCSEKNSCYISIRHLRDGLSSREAPPSWMLEEKEVFVFRYIAVLPKGKKANGEDFTLTRSERETIAQTAKNDFFYLGGFDVNNPFFVGENCKVHQCFMVPEEQKKSAAQRVLEKQAKSMKKDWDERGLLMIFDPLTEPWR